MYLNFQEALKGGSKKDWKKWDGHLKLKATKRCEATTYMLNSWHQSQGVNGGSVDRPRQASSIEGPHTGIFTAQHIFQGLDL